MILRTTLFMSSTRNRKENSLQRKKTRESLQKKIRRKIELAIENTKNCFAILRTKFRMNSKHPRYSNSFVKMKKMSPLWSEKNGHHLLQNLLDQNSIENYRYFIVQCFECQLFLKLDYCWFWMNFQIGSEMTSFAIFDRRPLETKKVFLFL
jgi:hypothetical protein